MSDATEFHWSELQRSPTRVERALLKHRRVRLLRRGKEPVILSATDSRDDIDDAAAVFAHALVDRSVHDAVAKSAAATWPWLSFFDADDQRTFSAELTSTLRACASIGEFGPLTHLLVRWRNTATAIAAGVDLKTPVRGDAGDVPRPRRRRGRAK